MYLLYKDGTIKTIPDSKDIRKDLNKEVKYVMINVGLFNNPVYTIIKAKKMITNIKKCTFSYSIVCYDANLYYDEVHCELLAEMNDIKIDTIEKFYNYMYSINRLYGTNSLYGECETNECGIMMDIGYFKLDLLTNDSKVHILCETNPELMPLEELNLDKITSKLKVLFKNDTIEIEKNEYVSIEDNRWDIKTCDDSDSGYAIDVGINEGVLIELHNLEGFYMMDNETYDCLRLIEEIKLTIIGFDKSVNYYSEDAHDTYDMVSESTFNNQSDYYAYNLRESLILISLYQYIFFLFHLIDIVYVTNIDSVQIVSEMYIGLDDGSSKVIYENGFIKNKSILDKIKNEDNEWGNYK